MNAPQFDHEKLNVYHAALAFVGEATDLLERVPKSAAVHNQLGRIFFTTATSRQAAHSSADPLAVSKKRHRSGAVHFPLPSAIFKGMAVEARSPGDIMEAKQMLLSVVSMLVGLIKAVAPNRVYEEQGTYGPQLPAEQEQAKEQV